MHANESISLIEIHVKIIGSLLILSVCLQAALPLLIENVVVIIAELVHTLCMQMKLYPC